MTDNTQELDEILENLTTAASDGQFIEDGSIGEAKVDILDWHNKQIYEARLNEVQNAYEYWINGRKFISSYFRDRIAELTKTLKEHKGE